MLANLLSLYTLKCPARLSSGENKTTCKQSSWCNLCNIPKPSTFYVNHVKIKIQTKLFDD